MFFMQNASGKGVLMQMTIVNVMFTWYTVALNSRRRMLLVRER